MKSNQQDNLRKPIPGYLLPVFIILILIAITGLVFYKYSQNNNYRVIKITGVTSVSNVSKFELFGNTGLTKDSSCYALVENGDLLLLDSIYYQVSASTADLLEVSVKQDTAIYINSKLFSLIVDNKVDLVPFLKSLSDEKIRSLDNLMIKTVIPVTYRPYLKKIAGSNKDLSLYFSEDSGLVILKDYLSNANYFNPKIFAGTISASLYPQLAGLININILFISISDSITTPLPYFSKLKTCILVDAGDEGLQRIMENNPNASLAFPDTDFFSNKDLKKFKQLPTLAIHIYDSAVLAGLDKTISNTSTLMVSCDTNLVSRELNSFINVKWLRLSGEIGEADLQKTITYFPKVQVLELNNVKGISSYKSIITLHNLHALIIRDTVTDYNTFSSLRQLKYLSLPNDIYSDSAKLKRIETALPGCIITPNAGACLGSAWLVLIPILVLITFYFNRNFIKSKLPGS